MRGLYLIAAVTMAGVSSIFALLNELEKAYDLPTSGLGWIAGAAFGAALVTQLTLARYADRGYGMLILRSGIVASALGLLWFAAATELWQFIAARALLGAGTGMIVPPARRAILLSADGNQGERLGTFYAAYLAGFVFGPPIAGLLFNIGDVRLPFLVLGLALAASPISIRGLTMESAEDASNSAAGSKRVLRKLLADRRVIAAMLVIVSFRYTIGVFEPIWAIYLDDLGVSTLWITLSLTGFALPMLLVARPAGRLSDRFGPRMTSLLSAAGTVPIMAAYGLVDSAAIVMAMAIPHGLLEAIQSPGTQAALADAAPKNDAAAAQGLGEAAGSAAAMIGAFTIAPIFAALGATSAWLIAAGVMVILLSASALLDRPTLYAKPREPEAAQVM